MEARLERIWIECLKSGDLRNVCTYISKAKWRSWRWQTPICLTLEFLKANGNLKERIIKNNIQYNTI